MSESQWLTFGIAGLGVIGTLLAPLIPLRWQARHEDRQRLDAHFAEVRAVLAPLLIASANFAAGVASVASFSRSFRQIPEAQRPSGDDYSEAVMLIRDSLMELSRQIVVAKLTVREEQLRSIVLEMERFIGTHSGAMASSSVVLAYSAKVEDETVDEVLLLVRRWSELHQELENLFAASAPKVSTRSSGASAPSPGRRRRG